MKENKPLEKGYCDICGSDEVDLVEKDATAPGLDDAFSMCEWCFHGGASEPYSHCFEKNEAIAIQSRGLRFLFEKLSKPL